MTGSFGFFHLISRPLVSLSINNYLRQQWNIFCYSFCEVALIFKHLYTS
nr:MAG TPA: hypothetical protein [Caudoviricetes sp.]